VGISVWKMVNLSIDKPLAMAEMTIPIWCLLYWLWWSNECTT
jgi:hypothetical protein